MQDPNEDIYPSSTDSQFWIRCSQCNLESLRYVRDEICGPCLWKPKGWIVTLSQLISWQTYEKELNSGDTLNWKVRGTKAKPGDILWICWRGRIRGWMIICGVVKTEGFVCTTTGKWWPAGTYIQRSGLFHYVKGPFMKGFRGVRSYGITRN